MVKRMEGSRSVTKEVSSTDGAEMGWGLGSKEAQSQEAVRRR